MRTMLQRRKWQAADSTDSALEPLLANIKAMKAMEKRIDKATELSELLGLEGQRICFILRGIPFYAKTRDGIRFPEEEPSTAR